MIISYFITHYPLRDSHKVNKGYIHGGAERAAWSLCREMAKNNKVNVYTTAFNNRQTIEKERNINIYRYRTVAKIQSSNISYDLFRMPDHDADVAHAHFSTPPAELAGKLYAQRKKIPFVLTYHGDWQESFGSPLRRALLTIYNKHFINRLLSFADVIICPSEYYIEESRFLNGYEKRIIVVPNGIDLESYNIGHSKSRCREILNLPIDKKIILFVGNLIPYKGPDVLIKAMEKIVKICPETFLVMVGDGLMRSELQNTALKHNLMKNIRFAGYVDGNEKLLYYKASDIFVLPSTMNTEVFPIVLLEASASELPIVVSDLNTFKCIIRDGHNGIVAKKNNEIDLASKIINLVSEPKECLRLGQNARKKVNDYTWEKISKITEGIYRGII
ncbi:MAG: glycosyltransferase family 4 protein [Peptococcaceae bacterium]|nr:glycosyltransferase family 4 protein [Peptococcaceae bacterium]